MSKNTKIEWATHSWSPWRGCTKVSPGCAHCYAEGLSKRFGESWGGWGKGAPRVVSKSWGDPMRWNHEAGIPTATNWNQRDDLGEPARAYGPRPRVFPSLCDWLDEEVSPSLLAEFLAIINLTPNIDWLLLTKRPENWRRLIDAAALASTPFHQRWIVEWLRGSPPPNVWFGVSVEDQQRTEERIPLLLAIPARLRWLSVEPLLGPIDLRPHAFSGFVHSTNCENEHCALAGGPEDCDGQAIPGVDWVVVGGESGPQSRPCDLGWVRDIVGQCKGAGVPVFVKQLGSNASCECGEPHRDGAVRGCGLVGAVLLPAPRRLRTGTAQCVEHKLRSRRTVRRRDRHRHVCCDLELLLHRSPCSVSSEVLCDDVCD